MSKATSCKEAIKNFETAKGVDATAAEKVTLLGQIPPIEKLDNSLQTLKAVKHLSLSTNSIDKITGLSGLENLQILSLGRNCIKRIENLDAVADSLEELWISYNNISSLSNLDKLQKLKVLFISNNKINSWEEVDKLSNNSVLENLLLVGNPLHAQYEDASTPSSEYRLQVLKRLPTLIKLDGIPIDPDERAAVKAL